MNLAEEAWFREGLPDPMWIYLGDRDNPVDDYDRDVPSQNRYSKTAKRKADETGMTPSMGISPTVGFRAKRAASLAGHIYHKAPLVIPFARSQKKERATYNTTIRLSPDTRRTKASTETNGASARASNRVQCPGPICRPGLST